MFATYDVWIDETIFSYMMYDLPINLNENDSYATDILVRTN